MSPLIFLHLNINIYSISYLGPSIRKACATTDLWFSERRGDAHGVGRASTRGSIQLDIENSIEYSIDFSIEFLQYCGTPCNAIEYSIEFSISN